MSQSPSLRPLAYALSVGASVIAGVGVAMQSRVNGELGFALGHGSLAALVSFSTGLLITTVAMALWRPGRVGFQAVRQALATRTLPWWAVLGGSAGAFFVMSQGLVGGIIGVALFSVAVVTGQTFGSVIIDARGLFGAMKVPLTPARLIGSVTVLVGVLVATAIWSESAAVLGWALLLPLISGLTVGWQQAVNGTVRQTARSTLTATFVNFLSGTLTLLIVVVVLLPFQPIPLEWPGAWWMYVGGALGAGFIAIQAFTVNQIGVLALGVSLIAGQILGAQALDWLYPVASSQITVWTVVGAALVLVGSALVTLTRRPTASS